MGDLDFDRLRDAALGRLSPAEQAELDARRLADPELDAAARDLADVLSAGEEPCPPCTLPFERIAAAAGLAPRPRLLPRLLLAGAVAAGIVATFLLRDDPAPERPAATGPVALAALSLAEPPATEPLPPSAADYAPVGSGGLAFVDGVAEGRALAAAVGRPLLVFVHVPDCPICRELRRSAFHDAALAKAAEGFVLADVDVSRSEEDLLGDVKAGWPPFVAFTSDGRRVDVFAGASLAGPAVDPANPNAPPGPVSFHVRTGPELAVEFERAARLARGEAAPVAWDVVHAVAARLSDAAAAPDLPSRLKLLDAAEAVAKGTSLAARVRAEQGVATRPARDAIATARDLVAAGRLDDAAKALEAAGAAFRGTPIADDLRRVRERLLADRRFPTLVETRTP